jgi:hypothetical protein
VEVYREDQWAIIYLRQVVVLPTQLPYGGRK